MLKAISSITNALGALNYKGTWNANANSPALASSVGTKGDYYVVGTAGTTTLNGISNWGIGDWAAFNGSVWQRVEGGADLNGVNLTVSGTSTLSGNAIISVTDNTNAALRITQLGTGNALLVEDSTNPDSSPFVINASGLLLRGITNPVNVTSELDGSQVNVGITNASNGNDAALALLNYANSTTNARPSYMVLGRSNGALNTQTAVAQYHQLGVIGFQGSDGTNFIRAASILAVVDGTPGTNDMPGRLVFSTTADGSATPTERMRIDSAGIVTMSAYGAGAATFSAAGVISSVSDETYKIKDGVIADPIPMVMALETGYYYGKPEANMGDGRQLGFYAQNVRAAIGPEAAPDPETYTVTDEDGVETIKTKPWGYYDRSVLAVAIEAIKVQQAQITALTARIAALEAKCP